MSEPGDEELEFDEEAWTAGGSPLDRAAFNADGLLPAIIQQAGTGEVLMLGWMDREAMRRTLTEGRVTFWSRSGRSTGARATRRATCSTCAPPRSTATPTRCS